MFILMLRSYFSLCVQFEYEIDSPIMNLRYSLNRTSKKLFLIRELLAKLVKTMHAPMHVEEIHELI